MPRLKATGACDWPRKAFSPQEDVDTAEATFHTAAADQDAFTAQQRAAEDNGKVAQADLKVAGTQLTANQAQVKQFEAALRSAQIDLAYTYIKAPVDGVVVSRNVDVGQTVAPACLLRLCFKSRRTLPRCRWIPTCRRRMWAACK
jgi:multidrug resistance efflux pump